MSRPGSVGTPPANRRRRSLSKLADDQRGRVVISHADESHFDRSFHLQAGASVVAYRDAAGLDGSPDLQTPPIVVADSNPASLHVNPNLQSRFRRGLHFVVSSFLPSGQTLRLQRVCQGLTTTNAAISAALRSGAMTSDRDQAMTYSRGVPLVI